MLKGDCGDGGSDERAGVDVAPYKHLDPDEQDRLLSLAILSTFEPLKI